MEAHYRAKGYDVVSVEHEKCGWDLTCTAPDGEVARVEVKGLSGSRPSVYLTRNELRSATEDAGWVLAVVTNAVRAPSVVLYDPAAVQAAAEPYVYRLDLAAADGLPALNPLLDLALRAEVTA